MVFSELFKIVCLAILTLICFVIVKPIKPEIALFIGLGGSCIILILSVEGITEIINTFTSFAEKTNINSSLFSLILKVIGIGYLVEFASGICLDSGSSGLADKIKKLNFIPTQTLTF